MERRRLPNELSEEDLLAIAVSDAPVSQQETNEHPALKDIHSFALAFNIRSGNKKVPNSLLYKLYKTWSKAPLSKSSFTLLFNNLFPPYSNSRYYKLSLNSLEISETLYNRLQSRKSKKHKSVTTRKNIQKFFDEHEISPGTDWIEGYVLYHMYDRWCYNRSKRTQFGSNTFYKICSTYFKQRRVTDSRMLWFGVNPTIRKYVSEETIANLRKAYKEQNGNKKEKKQKK